MQIIYTGKHVDVTPASKQYAEGKLTKLSRFFDHVQEVHFIESKLRNQQVVEVTVKANGTIIRAEERANDTHSAIDLVVDKLERQLSRYKDRFVTRTRESLGGMKTAEVVPAPAVGETAAPTPEETASTIVRTKRFAIKPMDPEEAAMEMELIGHDFYVFRNAENNQVNVVYRRRDGNYGLIEPSVD